MTTLRTVIFIDGENFRNNLRHFSFQSTPPHPTNPYYRLEEQHFCWSRFFDKLLKEYDAITGWDHRLIRAYWYYAATISRWEEDQRMARAIAQKHADTVTLTPQEVTDLAKAWYERERRYFEKLRDDVFENIQRTTDFLEFKYVGQYIVRPYWVHKLEKDSQGNVSYLGVQQGEKGVDVGIAMDMVAKMQDYDTAILVSGDADFLPAVRYLKDHLKYVYQFSVAEGVPPSIRYLSAYLKSYVDCFAYFDEVRLLEEFLKRASVPPPIVQVIDARIASLKASSAALRHC